jgi:Protein kinase domain
MAPEQFRSERLDARSDLYSLGCVLYELLVGSPPFEAVTNPAAIMYKHFSETPAPPRWRRSDVPEHLERLTLELLAKDPGQRPPTAAAVVTSLGGSGTGGAHRPSPKPEGTTAGWAAAPAAAPTGPPGDGATTQDEAPQTRTRRGPRRKSLILGLAAAVVAVVAGGAVALRWGPGAAQVHPPRPVKSSPTPARQQATRPVIAGWDVTLAPQYGVAYDVPPTWKRRTPDYAIYFQDAEDRILAAEKGVAEMSKGRCTRSATGLRGGSRPVSKPSKDQLDPLRTAAGDEVRKWAAAAYGQADAHPTQPRMTRGETGIITVNGIEAARASVRVTPVAGGDPCTPPHAWVETVAMAATPSSASVGPVFFTVFADRNVPGQVTDEDLKKIISSIRPYTCPSGTAPRKNNRCA